MSSLPKDLGLEVVDGPRRVGSELRWRVRDGGEPALLGQLLPELAHDPSLRRRYVRDVERLQALGDAGLARIRRSGPSPDPRDPTAVPPWRLRDDPPGETLESWLDRRAPAPADEAARVVAALAERVHQLHARGAVLRDLNPRDVVLGQDGTPWLTDIGLARVDVLSTRTAASLLLEGSPYAAPELLAHTIVDQRADLYGLGVILFRALSGALPYGDASSLLRPPGPSPRVSSVRADVPPHLDELVARCLAEDPARRPGTAAELAEALRGRASLPALGERVPCQSCGTELVVGQRLCIRCGKLAVRFETAPDGEGQRVELRKIDESAQSRAKLQEILEAIAEGPVPALNFLVGDARMYSKEERERYIKLPATLVANLRPDSATALQERLRDAGLQTQVVDRSKGGALTKPQRRGLAIGAVAGMIAAGIAALALPGAVGIGVMITLAAVTAIVVTIVALALKRSQKHVGEALVQLRPAPAALPASDPLVARLAALLSKDTPEDLREQVGELALAVQRLVDHRARNLVEAAEIDAVTAPVQQLVGLVETHVQAIRRIDEELAGLDEGALVRALAAAEARRDPPAVREELLHGLDRLRALEDARALRFHQLLEASRLARRAVELGLSVHDETAEHERQVALALAALERDLDRDDGDGNQLDEPPPSRALTAGA